MNIKRNICAALAGTMLLGTSAMAKENIYAYNKFIATVLGPQVGYCDFGASFKDHNDDYEMDVNDFFTGLISAFYDDIDADMDNELITVDTHGVTVYQAEENGVVYLGSINRDLIANYGNSYANVFTVPVGEKQYVALETYGKTVNDYYMYMYELDPETDEFKMVLEIKREDNEDGLEESVWAGGKTYYSATNAGGLKTSINPDKYTDCIAAAKAALAAVVPDVEFNADELRSRITGTVDGDDFRFNVSGVIPRTYIHARGLRFSSDPVVIFEDNTQLDELSKEPILVSVVLDGKSLQFPDQEPVIIDGRTLVPMRTIFEAFGAEVEWIDEDGVQSIIATTDDAEISMTINSPEFTINGEIKTLDVPAQLINDKTLVPVRAISESLGCYVGWDQYSHTVIIQTMVD